MSRKSNIIQIRPEVRAVAVLVNTEDSGRTETVYL